MWISVRNPQIVRAGEKDVAGTTTSIKLKNKSLVQRNWSCEVRCAVEIIRAYDREQKAAIRGVRGGDVVPEFIKCGLYAGWGFWDDTGTEVRAGQAALALSLWEKVLVPPALIFIHRAIFYAQFAS